MTRTDARPKAGPSNRLTAVRERVRSWPGGTLGWRIGVTVVGVAIIIGGIILLPLPGPGWLIIFAGMGVLATEYEWAKRLLGWARAKLKEWTDWTRQQPRWLQGLIGLLGLAFLVGVAFGAWWLTH